MPDKKVIDSFTLASGYGFLSNFHPSTIYIEGKSYPTVEHAYQSYKTLNESSREIIRLSKNPYDAKKLARSIEIRPDWDDIKENLMLQFIRKKFENPFLRPLLLSTGDSELIFNNTWNDRVWGVCRGSGKNLLGKILMQVRKEIRENPDT